MHLMHDQCFAKPAGTSGFTHSTEMLSKARGCGFSPLRPTLTFESLTFSGCFRWHNEDYYVVNANSSVCKGIEIRRFWF